MIIVEIAGFLGADPEERFTATGKRVVSLRVATRIRQGGQDETVWWKINIWGDRFDKMLPYLKKGSAIIIVGDMAKPETYTARDGSTQISLTLNAEMIKFSPFGKPDSKSDRPAESQARPQPDDSLTPQQPAQSQPQYAGFGASTEQQSSSFAGDDLPF